MNTETESDSLKILVVEDCVVDAQLITAFLSKAQWMQFDTEHFTDIESAKDRVAQGGIDVVLLDLGLPDSFGLDTLYSMHEQAPELPILVITGDDNEEQAIEALRCGAQDYLIKNQVNVNLLSRAIRYSLERKETEEELRLAKTEAEQMGWYIHEANEKLTHEIAERKKLEEEREKTIALLIELNEKLRDGERKLLEANKKLEIQATTDPLTGLFNRRRGREIMDKEIARVDRDLQHLALTILDIDHFKKVNDKHGHDGGDAVLVEVANRLKTSSREYDSIVRWGGEEILIICPDTSTETIVSVAERLRETIAAQPVKTDEAEISISASFGTISSESFPGANINELISRCDEALYKAKSEGRNCVRSAVIPQQ